MTTAHTIMTNLIERIMHMQEFIIQIRLDEFVTNGPLPFDVKYSDGVATATVFAVTIEEAKKQVSDYFQSEDFI